MNTVNAFEAECQMHEVLNEVGNGGQEFYCLGPIHEGVMVDLPFTYSLLIAPGLVLINLLKGHIILN